MRHTEPQLEELFEGLTESLPVLGIVFSADGVFVDFIANDLTEHFLVDDPADLVGKSLDAALPETKAEEFSEIIAQAQDTHTVIEHEYQLTTKAGRRYFRGRVAPISDAGANTDHVVWIAEDITARTRYEEQIQRFRRAVEAAHHAVYITDPDGRIQYTNPAFERITGYSVGDALGSTPRIMTSGEMPDSHFEELWETLRAGEIWEEEVINRRKNGERYDASQTIAPVTDENGDVEAFVAVQQDITDRTELKEQRKREQEHLTRTEQLANVGGWEYHPETGTLLWTDGTREIFEVSDGFDPTIETAYEFYHPEDRSIIEQAVEHCLENGVPYSVTLRIITDAGRQRWVHAKGERVEEDDGTIKLSGVIQDITEQKTNEQRLMVMNRILRHNLRNKLNVVRGYAEEIQNDLPQEHAVKFDQIQSSAASLMSLAEKSRRFNRALEIDYTAELVPLDTVLMELSQEYRADYSLAVIETDLRSDSVPGNRDAVRMLFAELLENALTHTEREEPLVRVVMARESPTRVTVSIIDNGPGLPETEQQVLEAGEETALVHSDGMGLWIVNWLTRKLSGGVSAGSNDDGGCTIRVTLPTWTSDAES